MKQDVESMTRVELIEEVRRLRGTPSPVPSILLLDCPFCGNAAEFDVYCEKDGTFLAYCPNCQISTIQGTKAEAAKTWNTRVQSNSLLDRSHLSNSEVKR